MSLHCSYTSVPLCSFQFLRGLVSVFKARWVLSARVPWNIDWGRVIWTEKHCMLANILRFFLCVWVYVCVYVSVYTDLCVYIYYIYIYKYICKKSFLYIWYHIIFHHSDDPVLMIKYQMGFVAVLAEAYIFFNKAHCEIHTRRHQPDAAKVAFPIQFHYITWLHLWAIVPV